MKSASFPAVVTPTAADRCSPAAARCWSVCGPTALLPAYADDTGHRDHPADPGHPGAGRRARQPGHVGVDHRAGRAAAGDRARPRLRRHEGRRRPDRRRRWLGTGYTVITYTARGFGGSGGLIHLGNPAYEGRDAVRVVDEAAARPEVAKDGGDPVIGFAGASYGGAAALLAAGLDPRVDAIVPAFTWHSLTQALVPQYAHRRRPDLAGRRHPGRRGRRVQAALGRAVLPQRAAGRLPRAGRPAGDLGAAVRPLRRPRSARSTCRRP